MNYTITATLKQHDIAELTRLYEEAAERSRHATIVAHAALTRLHTAILENSGLAGHIIEGLEYGFSRRPNRIIVSEVYGEYFCGRIAKKDGTAGGRLARVRIDKATDLGPATCPTPAQKPCSTSSWA